MSLELVGTGYRAEVKGQRAQPRARFLAPGEVQLPDSVSARVEIIDEAGIKKSAPAPDVADKELLGQTAARSAFRPPEPYRGKGVRYTGEKVREKAGKAGGRRRAKGVCSSEAAARRSRQVR